MTQRATLAEQPPVARLLIVDDSASIIRMTTMLLTAAGYQVDAAASGEEAFDKFLTAGHDLVVSDITMGALSGVQLCRLIRNDPASAHVPVILLTGADDSRSRFWARSAGATAYVAKEAMRHTLVAEVKRALAQSVEDGRRGTPAVQKQSSMARLCHVLDDLLFDAVIASEVRRLVSAPDQKAFARSITELASDVATYAFLLVRLDGPERPIFVVHARDEWPTDERGALRALGLDEGADVEAIATGPTGPDVQFAPGERTSFPICSGAASVGEMVVYAGSKALAESDRKTLELLARELGTVAKTQFLMEQTKLLAQTDALTGLYNRRYTSSTLDLEVARTNRYATPLSAILLDIDLFKSVNDRFGHNAGDEVIRRVAGVLRSGVRVNDVAGRWGGEEFLVLLTNTSADGAAVVAERVRSSIEALGPTAGGPDRITVSAGVAEHSHGRNGLTLVERADQALYRAKEKGRNRVALAVEPSDSQTERK